jgi:hypothetical protein
MRVHHASYSNAGARWKFPRNTHIDTGGVSRGGFIAAGRESFLRDRCGDDWQLREEVLLLLKYDTPHDSTGETGLLEALRTGAVGDSAEGEDAPAQKKSAARCQ